MENKDFDQVNDPTKNNSEYRKLKEEHHRLEIELNELVRHKTLTPEEETEKKRIQVEKLQMKDRMEWILRSGKDNVGFER